MITTYVDHIQASIDRFAATSLVLETQINVETRPAKQGYIHGSITFADSSVLFFREYLDADKEEINKDMYVYHYQDKDYNFIFRYDNARHKPPLQYAEHKHIPGQIVEAPAPTLEDVLFEIVQTRGWTLEQ